MADTDRTTVIKIDLSIEPGKFIPDLTPREMGEAMEPEVKKFDQWFQAQGNEPMVMAESAILKTYLGWKLKFEGKS
jgi:hypothetical protein